MRVDDDAGAAQPFFPSMAVDPYTGYVHIVFYDRRNTVGNATDVYLATSTDGGATFTNVEISDSSFTPASTVLFGDSTDIAAVGGMVRPIWMRMDNGILTVWTAMIEPATGVAEWHVPTRDVALLEPMETAGVNLRFVYGREESRYRRSSNGYPRVTPMRMITCIRMIHWGAISAWNRCLGIRSHANSSIAASAGCAVKGSIRWNGWSHRPVFFSVVPVGW